jgi:serine phosphatase RsbU (regulator of sigma subunit)
MRREWTERDREVLETLSEAAGAEVALRRALVAERQARELADAIASSAAALARTLQESLLPPVLEAPPGLEIAARYRPAGSGIEVVGDFYDVFQSGRDAWNVVIGDVMGKGIEAAKLTALAHYTLRAAAMRSDSPSATLRTLNRALLEQASAEDPRFLTALHLTFTPGRLPVRLALCSAGHEVPVLKRAGGATTSLELRGTLLGALPHPVLEDVTVELGPGDQLLLYTDGVLDGKRGRERFGLDRLLATVAECPPGSADALADAVEAAALEFNEGALPDDAALVVLHATRP